MEISCYFKLHEILFGLYTTFYRIFILYCFQIFFRPMPFPTSRRCSLAPPPIMFLPFIYFKWQILLHIINKLQRNQKLNCTFCNTQKKMLCKIIDILYFFNTLTFDIILWLQRSRSSVGREKTRIRSRPK